MGYSYKGYFRYLISSGGGGIGIPVVAFNAPDGPIVPWRLANMQNDQDVSGALYSATVVGHLYLLLPNMLNDPEENENHGKFADLSHLAQYAEKYGGSLSMSFAIEKYSDGKLISLYTLRDEKAAVRSIDLVNNSYVWNTALDLRLPNAVLMSDGNRLAVHQ